MDDSKDNAGVSEFGTPADLLLNIPRPPLNSLDSPVKEERSLQLCGMPDSLRQVYETLQFLIDTVCLEIDGDEGDKDNALLKRLLQSSPPSDKEIERSSRTKPIGRPAATGKRGAGGSPLKRRKKVVKGKTAASTSYDDYAVFVERVSIGLKSLPRLPVQEPFPRADRFSCQVPGTTNLPDRSDKPLVIADTMGEVRLSFQPDFFTEIFGKSVPLKAPVASKTEQGPRGSCRQNGFSSNQSSAVKNSISQPLLPESQQLAPKSIIEQLKALDDEGLFDLVYEGMTPEAEEQELALAYPALKMSIPPEGRMSPNFRLMLAIPTMRPVPPDPPRELFYKIPEKAAVYQREVPVTVTLGVEAARNVSNVMQELALLLNLSSPIEYHIETPPHTPEKEGNNREISDQNARDVVQRCRHCAALVEQEAIKKRFAELGLTPKEDEKDYALFCSSACFTQFSAAYKAPLPDVDGKDNEKLDFVSEDSSIRIQHGSSTVAETVEEVAAVGSMKPVKKEESSDDFKLEEIIRSVVGGVQSYSSGPKENYLHIKDLPQPESNQQEFGRHGKMERRWKGKRWQVWNRSFTATFTRLQDQLDELLEDLKYKFYPAALPKDSRKCELCASEGDANMEGPGRLLNLDAARWVHVNCALWSSEVYETVGGALINVDAAVRRGQTITCVHCSELGATIPCYKLRCEQQYHFPCALQVGCCFTADKTLLCPEHKLLDKDQYVELNRLGVLRKVYVERDEDHLIAKLFQQGDQAGLALRVGSLIFHHVGQLLPHQLRTFHNKDFVFPVGYSVTRFYWSPAFLNRRVKYQCSITEHSNSPQFVLSYSDYGCSELTLTDNSANNVWNKILDPLERLRHKQGPGDQLKLFPRYLTGELLFGLTEPSILKMLESLPGVETLLTYNFKYGRSPLMDLPLAVNPSGCARCEPRFRTYLKRHRTLHAAGNSGSSNSSGGGSAGSPSASGSLTWQELALMFGKMEAQTAGNSSKWSLYKKMKADWRNTVYLARSKIQGLGLYAKKDIEMNAMIIEYLGDVIRNEVAERREKLYQLQNRGVYMFRLDGEKVVDATMSGGPARYINHSCDPNCATQLVTINGDLKIVVVACRPISRHEELTYDYQFDFEDENSKIPCLCGAPNCRKWMN